MNQTIADVGQVDRDLLAAVRRAVDGAAMELSKVLIDVSMQAQRRSLSMLLRAAAIRGLDDATAERVGSQIDAVLQVVKGGTNFKRPDIKIARDDQGRVEFRYAIDVASVAHTIEGGGWKVARPEGVEVPPQMKHFVLTVSGLPAPHYVLPPPQTIINTGAPMRQVVKRDAEGEIESIETVPQPA